MEYYKDNTTRLYNIDEIKEEGEGILNNDYDMINMNIEMQDGDIFIALITLKSRIIENSIVKVKLNQNNKCSYFKMIDKID